MHDLVIRGGTLVGPDEVYAADIAADGGRFSAIYQPGCAPESACTLDASGLFVLPGLIDPHVHIGYPDRDWRDDCTATTCAAAAGGVTTVMDFLAAETPALEQLDQALGHMRGRAQVDIAFHAGVFTWPHVQDIEACAQKGLTSFKLYMPYAGHDLPAEWQLSDDKLWESFVRIARLGRPAIAMIHAENQLVIDRLAAQHAFAPPETWSGFRPDFAEAESISRVGHFAMACGCPLYIAHVSSQAAVEEIRHLRRRGCNILAETCAHYLVLNNRNCAPALGKINPPLREPADNEALWQAVSEGIITCIGSDHSSCSLEHKSDVEHGIPGFAGVQTTLPVLLDAVNRGRLSLPQLAALCSRNPARAFGLDGCKGALRVGLDADFVLVDMAETRTVHARDLLHISDYTPFEGMKLQGWPVATYLRGRPVAQNGRIAAGQPDGRYIPRPLHGA